MNLIPYEALSIETPQSSEEIIKRLEDIVANSALGWESHKRFKGKVDGNTFKIRRLIGGRNSFLPVIQGQIKSGLVEIKMRLSYPVAIFSFLWLLITGLVAIFTLLSTLLSKGANTMGLSSSIGLFLFGYCLLIICFDMEAEKAKRLLRETLLPVNIT